jgi:predicted kinase
MKLLYLTVGLPYSGKSTWARESDLPIVSPDAIRVALHGQRFISSAEPVVWATARLMVAALFEAGHDLVVLDATNTTRQRRAEWRDPRWVRVFVELAAPPDLCIQRAEARDDTQIIPVIKRMAEAFEPPSQDELDPPERLAWQEWESLEDPTEAADRTREALSGTKGVG